MVLHLTQCSAVLDIICVSYDLICNESILNLSSFVCTIKNFFEQMTLDECVSINIAEKSTRLCPWEDITRKRKKKKAKTRPDLFPYKVECHFYPIFFLAIALCLCISDMPSGKCWHKYDHGMS